MKHIKITSCNCDYPIGSNMRSVRTVITAFRLGFRKLKYPKNSKFNIWCRGSSGAILATAFSLVFPQHTFYICHVRKPGERAHSDAGYVADKQAINIIIDDFISSGETISSIIAYMTKREHSPNILIVMGYCQAHKFNPLFDTIISS